MARALVSASLRGASIRWQVWAVLGLNLIGIGLWCLFAARGWPGAPSRCLHDIVCYCETPVDGWARQPFNTWSNLACVPPALFIARDAAAQREHTPRVRYVLGSSFAFVLSAQGLGSMFFHGSLTQGGAVLDAVSLMLIPAIALGVNLLRLGYLKARQVPAFLGAASALALAFRLFVLPVMAPLVALVVILVLWTGARVWRLERSNAVRRTWLGVLGVAAACTLIWALSLRPGFPLCPARWPLGHGVFHVAGAGLTTALWFYARRLLTDRTAHIGARIPT
jgi:hypothetical protein